MTKQGGALLLQRSAFRVCVCVCWRLLAPDTFRMLLSKLRHFAWLVCSSGACVVVDSPARAHGHVPQSWLYATLKARVCEDVSTMFAPASVRVIFVECRCTVGPHERSVHLLMLAARYPQCLADSKPCLLMRVPV